MAHTLFRVTPLGPLGAPSGSPQSPPPAALRPSVHARMTAHPLHTQIYANRVESGAVTPNRHFLFKRLGAKIQKHLQRL